MGNLFEIIEKARVPLYKIVGKKVLLNHLSLRNIPERLDSKTEVYTVYLDTNYIPSCIKKCKQLFFTVDEDFDGDLPLVSDFIKINSSKYNSTSNILQSDFKRVKLNNIKCDSVELYNNIYTGSVHSNHINLGFCTNTATSSDLIVEGIGESPVFSSELEDILGDLCIRNFNSVTLCCNTELSDPKIEIRDCDAVEILSIPSIYNCSNFTLFNVDKMIVTCFFIKECIVEVNNLAINNLQYALDFRSKNNCKGIYLCDICYIDGIEYSKSNPYKGYLPNVQFK